jgi:hypothetical protein
MSANYIGAFARVNIGQFDVKRLAQNGCVETNRRDPNFAKLVNIGSIVGRSACWPLLVVVKTTACKRWLLL